MTDHDASSLFYPYTRARTQRGAIGNDVSSCVMRHARGMADSPRCLIPFDRREGMPVEEAAEIAGRDVRTLRRWCVERDIGRRIAGGPWIISRIALAMLLNDDVVSLAAYLAGDRTSAQVRTYFEMAGLADLPQRWTGSRQVPG